MTDKDGLVQKRDLTAQEERAVDALGVTCNAYEGLDLKLAPGPAFGPTDEDGAHILSYAGGALVGYCALDTSNRTPVELCGMVHPDYRRQGIGRTLLGAAQATCARWGAAPLLLVCEDAAASGRAFVAAIGATHRFSEYRLILDPAAFQARSPVPERLTLQVAGIGDVETLAYVRAAAFGDPIEEARGHILSRLDDPHEQYYLARLGGEPIGIIKPIIMDRAAFIYAFAVLPAYQGRGFGREMLSRTVAMLLAQGYAPIGIEVETGNRNALGLYLSCGFRESVTYGYYEVETSAQQPA